MNNEIVYITQHGPIEIAAPPYYKALADILDPLDGSAPFYSLSITLNA